MYTPENPSFTIQDPSLQKDVPDSVEIIKLPIWEPYDLFFKVARFFDGHSGKPTDMIATGKKSFFQKVSSFIRGNFFIPDARVFWVRPSVTFLHDFLRANEIKKIITTGPPHSIHLIGLALKKKDPSLRWIADFRDPWSEWDLLDTLSLTQWARRRHRALEKKVLTTADDVITIAPFHVTRLEALSGRKVQLITNGFDEDDFAEIVHKKTSRFTIRHVGVVDELRDPRPVMEAVKALCLENPKFASNVLIEFIGNVNSAFKKFVVEDEQLNKVTRFVDQMPHNELLKLYGETDLQLLVLAHTAIAPGNLPGKFFEYLASGNPILAIGPTEGDAGSILRNNHLGVVVERQDIKGIELFLNEIFGMWRVDFRYNFTEVGSFSRKRLTEQVASLLNK